MNIQTITKALGIASIILGLVATAYPMPDILKVYILGTETVINGIAQYVSANWLAAPVASEPTTKT